jgi:hypothetical protein
MLVEGSTGRGPLPLIKVESRAKINARYYINKVLKRYLEKEIPKKYDVHREVVFVHHDNATSYTAAATQEYLRSIEVRTRIRFIKNDYIPVKGCDVAPMDFYGFGHLKQKMFGRLARTIDGACKIAKQIWSRISIDQIKNVYAS